MPKQVGKFQTQQTEAPEDEPSNIYLPVFNLKSSQTHLVVKLPRDSVWYKKQVRKLHFLVFAFHYVRAPKTEQTRFVISFKNTLKIEHTQQDTTKTTHTTNDTRRQQQQ